MGNDVKIPKNFREEKKKKGRIGGGKGINRINN